MDSPSEQFKTQLLALIERKIAPLEQEIREQSELIAKLAEQTAVLSRPKGLFRSVEETKSLKPVKDQSEPESKKTKAEEVKSKAEEAKRKAEEEKSKKAEAKRKQEESAKKKQEEDKANREKAKKEAEDKKRESEEKKKKELSSKAKKSTEEAKKPPEEAKKSIKRPPTAKKPEITEEPELATPVQDQSSEAAPPAENKDAVLTIESREGTEESEPIDLLKEDPPVSRHGDDSKLVVPEPSLNENLDSETLLLSTHLSDQPAFIDDEAQPSAPEHEDHSQELALIDAEIKRLIDSHGEETLQKTPKFQLSLGAKSAMSLLNTLDEAQLYLNTLPNREETMWVFRLFFQLGGKTLPEEKREAWDVCRQFLAKGKEAGMDRSVQDAVYAFEFSNENIDLVDKALAGKTDKVNPNLYNQFCTLTGLIMFTVKEGVTYAGLIPEKAAPWRKYQRLLYRRGKLVSR